MWSTMRGPDDGELVRSLSGAEMVARPGARWHYSNLGYALLGQIVARVSGVSCARMIDAELIEPLRLKHTTWEPLTTAATGYRLDPYEDVAHPEPVMDQGAVGVGGQLWATAGDLLVWADALMGGAPQILPEPITAAMHTLHVMTDRERWTQGWGLGLSLERTEHGIMSGHTGAMPGFLAAFLMDRGTRTAVVAFTNVTRGIRLSPLAAELLSEALSYLADPSDEDRRQVDDEAPAPPELDGVLGRWWSEAEETVFAWNAGALRAQLVDPVPGTGPSVFAQVGLDRYRATTGRFEGELLLVQRDDNGKVSGLEWATYPFSRVPR